MTEPTPVSANPRRARHRLRISVGMSMLLIALVAVWLAWLTNRARRQAEVVAEMKERFIEFHFDYEDQPGRRLLVGGAIPNAQPRGPVWLRRQLGDEYFRKIASVSWPGIEGRVKTRRPADDVFFARLASFGGLRQLALHSRAVSSRAFVKTTGLSDLDDLELWDCPNVSDDIFIAIARMPRLQTLVIEECGLSGGDCPGLEKLSALRVLALGATKLTAHCLSRINSNRSLEILVLHSPLMTDATLAQLDLPKLREFNLSSECVTGVGFSSLARSSQLVEVSLFCNMTDEGIAALRGCKKLLALRIFPRGRPLSDRALDSLRELSDLRSIEILGRTGEFTTFTRAAILNLVDALPNLGHLSLRREDPGHTLKQEIHERHPNLQVQFEFE